MIVTGLSGNRFLIGNKIPVKIELNNGEFEIGSVITITITKLVIFSSDTELILPDIKLFPYGGFLEFDLAPYIKGLINYPYSPDGGLSDEFNGIIPNMGFFNIAISENQNNTSQIFLNKTFIRGFKRENSKEAFTIPVNTILSPVEKIPYWTSYPTGKFYINIGNYIICEPIIVNPNEFKLMPTPSNCDPFYIRFLNSLGGYSFWLFNAWEWNTSSKSKGVVNDLLERHSLGFTEDNTVNLDARVKREFFPLMKDLIVSPMIQVYNKFGADKWLKIDLKSSSFKENNYEDLIEFNCTVDLNLGNNPQVLW